MIHLIGWNQDNEADELIKNIEKTKQRLSQKREVFRFPRSLVSVLNYPVNNPLLYQNIDLDFSNPTPQMIEDAAKAGVGNIVNTVNLY